MKRTLNDTKYKCARCAFSLGYVEDESFSHEFGTEVDYFPTYVLEECQHPVLNIVEKLNIEKDFETVYGKPGVDMCPEQEFKDDEDIEQIETLKDQIEEV